MMYIFLVSTCLFNVVLSQNEGFTLPDSLALPPEIQQQLNNSEIELAKNKYMDQFKQKCEKNGHPEAFDNVMNAANTLMGCVTSLVDINMLQEEIENAKPQGKVDEVFKKYCDKTPQFRQCFHNTTETIKPCFSANEQKNFKILYNITDILTDFICFKDGDRIALFIAEGGQECFQEKQELLQNCFNQTFDNQTQTNLKNISIDDDFELDFKEKQCNQFTQLQKCVVGVLTGCAKSTSANIVDSLFDFVRSATPCQKYKVQKGNTRGAANGLTGTFMIVLIALTSVILA